jgi:hypothetical protein
VAGNFSHHRVQTGSGALLTSYAVGTRGSSLGIKRPGHEADYLLPSSAEVKNAWSYSSVPPVRLYGVVLNLQKSTGTVLHIPLPLTVYNYCHEIRRSIKVTANG